MPSEQLEARMQLLVELALDAECSCQQVRSNQEARAKTLGLVGVEIDAARERRSFDVRTSAAIDVACALAFSDNENIRAAEQQALAVGFTPQELALLRELVISAHRGP